MSSHRFALETIKSTRHGSTCFLCEQLIDSGYLVTFSRPHTCRFKVHRHCAYFYMQRVLDEITPDNIYECERNLFHIRTVVYPYAIIKVCFCYDFVRIHSLVGVFSALDPSAPRMLHVSCGREFALALKDHFSCGHDAFSALKSYHDMYDRESIPPK